MGHFVVFFSLVLLLLWLVVCFVRRWLSTSVLCIFYDFFIVAKPGPARGTNLEIRVRCLGFFLHEVVVGRWRLFSGLLSDLLLLSLLMIVELLLRRGPWGLHCLVFTAHLCIFTARHSSLTSPILF